VKSFFEGLRSSWDHRPFVWHEGSEVSDSMPPTPNRGKVLALSPHPDDPESAAVTLRLLGRSGCQIRYAIATLSPRGVAASYAPGSSEREKAELRRREQLRAAKEAGLGRDEVVFLDLDDELSAEVDSAVKSHLDDLLPDIVILPTGEDENHTHRWLWELFRAHAPDLAARKGSPLLGMYNEDPKTIRLRSDLFVCFSAEAAEWKKSLLRIHDSQQARNLQSRGVGFDERILSVNRAAAERLTVDTHMDAEYAEAFELELFDTHEGER
jgi:LmbE family N-acetylglucosaminyl deacetylase